MRVSSNSYSDSLLNHLQKLARRQSTLQTQIASGQRVQSAADDPVAAQRVLTLRDDAVATAQYRKNIDTHEEFATVTGTALQQLQKVLDRAQEIAVSADDLDSPGGLKSLGVEVGELIKQAVSIANTSHRGEYIFSGTKGSASAVSTATDETGQVTGVTFNGNSTQASSEVAPDVLIASRITAQNSDDSGELGLFADSRSGTDLFQHLINLRDQLLAGDTAGIAATTRKDLQGDEDSVLYHIAGNGALQSRLETMTKLNTGEKSAIEEDLSDNADIDMSEAVIRLSQQQTAYQATLQSAGSVMNLSLLSFLR
jgi:flagellar hook-associated protein 3 FlgL